MNRIIWKEILREIQHSLPRFLSIIVIIALGVAFFIGIRAAGPSMLETTQTYYRENHLPHGTVVGTYGLDQQDMDKITQVDVEWLPMKTVKSKITTGDYSVKIYTLPPKKQENFFKVVKGRFPQKADEIVLDSQFLTYINPTADHPLNLGDGIEVEKNTPDQDNNAAPHLNQFKFKVVGFVQSPIYFDRTSRGNDAVDVFAVVLPQAIEGTLYTEAFFWDPSLNKQKAFDPQWEDQLDQRKKELEAVLKDQGQVRLSSLTQEIEDQIANGEKAIESGYDALESGRDTLEEAQSQLESASRVLVEGKAEWASGSRDLEEGKTVYQSGLTDYRNGAQAIADNEALLAGYQASYEDGLAQYNEGMAVYQSGLTSAENALIYNQSVLESGYNDLEMAGSLLESGQAQLDSVKEVANSVIRSIVPGTNITIDDLASILAQYPDEIESIRQRIADLQASLEQAFDESRLPSMPTSSPSAPPVDTAPSTLSDSGNTSTVDLNQIQDLNTQIADLQAYRDQIAFQLEQLISAAGGPDETPTGPPVEINQEAIDSLTQEIITTDSQLADLVNQWDQLTVQSQAEMTSTLAVEEGPENYPIDTPTDTPIDNVADNRDANPTNTSANIPNDTPREEPGAPEEPLVDFSMDPAMPFPDIPWESINRDEINSLMASLEDLSLERETWASIWNDYSGQLDQFLTAESQMQAGWQSYQAGLATLNSASQALDVGWAQYHLLRNIPPAQLIAAQQQLAEAQAQLNVGWAQLAEGKTQLESASLALDQARLEIAEGQSALDEGAASLKSGEEAYQKGLEDYLSGSEAFDESEAEAIAKLASAQKEIDDAHQALKKLLTPKYLVNLAQNDGVYQGIYNNASQLDVISNIFPVFFLLIAILVTYSTIKRMTFEQRNFMGTLKQMGYSDEIIIGKFSLYSGSASTVGIILGLVTGYLVFPPVILAAYNIIYLFDTPVIHYSAFWMVVIAMIAMATALGPAIFSPKKILKAVPARLLRPPAPPAGKKILMERIPLIWQRISFKHKITIRNLFRYKGRNLMTLFGVAGCTMLIVTGFGISDTISGIVDKQFNQIQKFDAMVILKEGVEADGVQEVQALLQDSPDIKAYIPIHQATVDTNVEGIANQAVNVVVPLEEGGANFSTYMNLHERENPDKRLAVKDGQILMTERLEEYVHTKQRGNLPVIYDNVERTLPVRFITENYTGHYLYLSPSDFEKYFFDKPTVNVFYLEYQPGEQAEINSLLTKNSHVLTVFNIDELASGVKNSLGSLDLITLVLIISAAGLAFVVLFNLTNINIEERMKELATIKVLGFYSHEVSLYIYDEILILTFVGSLLGLGLGKLLTHFIMKTMQLSDILFYPTIHLKSYLFSFALTFVFSAVVMYVMHRKIKAIDMVEALKAVE